MATLTQPAINLPSFIQFDLISEKILSVTFQLRQHGRSPSHKPNCPKVSTLATCPKSIFQLVSVSKFGTFLHHASLQQAALKLCSPVNLLIISEEEQIPTMWATAPSASRRLQCDSTEGCTVTFNDHLLAS